MLLQEENWLTGYKQLIADCRPSNTHFSGTSSGTVLILCNPDADALCAARILRCILRADNIPFQLRPCGGMRKLVSILESLNLYSDGDLDSNEDVNDGIHDFENGGEGGYIDSEYNYDYEGSERNTNSTSSSSIRVVILLNLGATKNLNKLLYSPRPIQTIAKNVSSNTTNQNDLDKSDDEEQEEHEGNDDNENEEVQHKPPLISRHIKTFVLDSHRPYHLANIHAGKNVVLWNDFEHWHQEEGGIPSDGEGLSGDEEVESDEDDDSDDDSSDSDDNDDSDDSDEGEAEFEDEIDVKVDNDVTYETLDQDTNGDEDLTGEKSQLKRTMSSPSQNHDNDDTLSSLTPNKRQRPDDPETPETQVMTDDENSPSQKRTRTQSQENEHNVSETSMMPMREQHEMRRTRIRKYYSGGSFYSSPVSFMAYTLSTMLRHASVGDLLWLACVGLTDAYIHNRLELSGYISLSIILQQSIREMYDSSNYIFRGDDNNDAYTMNLMNQQVENTFHAEDLYTNSQSDLYGSGGDGNSVIGANYNGPMTKVGFSDNGKILIQKDEFRFFLLRHVSLWQAMVLSPEVSTKMELWKSSGKKKLQEMLAKMGVPLSQCQQPYAFMKPMLKRRLKMVFEEHSEEYGLDNLKYTAFLRVTGYKSLLSASDVAYAVTALLECDTETNNNTSQNEIDVEAEEERKQMNSFNIAYDALNPNSNVSPSGLSCCGLGDGSDLSSLVNGGEVSSSAKGITGGIRLAITLQSAIFHTAMGLVERNAITRLSHFRYAYLHATSEGANRGSSFNSSGASKSALGDNSYNQHIFSKPLALTKLAIFLMDMHRTNKKWTGTKARPLLLLAEKPQTQTYLVAGFEFHEERGNVKHNTFKEKFKLATDSFQGSFKYDSFESNVVEVSSHDVQKFIEHLHYMIDAVE